MKHIFTCVIAYALTGMTTISSADDRTHAWREDIELTRTEFLQRDLSYNEESRAAADATLRALSERVEHLSDAEIVAGLARVAAMSNNAHTRAYVLRNRGVWRRYPIRIWKFGEEWRVIAARPELSALLGARLIRIGGRPVERAEEHVRPLFAGNDNWAAYMAGYSLTSPDALLGVGVQRRDRATRFVFERDGRRINALLTPEPLERRERPEENWWFLSPAHPANDGWAHVLSAAPLPPPLAGAGAHYALHRCNGAAYLQINRASDAPQGESMQAFGERVLAELETDPPALLIVDLRFNTGGNLGLGWRFFNALAASPLGQEAGRIAVVLGPTTFSAGITHAAQMRERSLATFFGTTPGDVLETWSEGGNVLLPNSQINMHYADRAHTYSAQPSSVPQDLVYLDLNIESLEPHAAATLTWSDYIAGRDPFTEAALGQPLSCPS